MGEAHLELLDRLLRELDRLALRTDRHALEDFERWLAVGHALQLLAQCCIDLGQSVLRGMASPPASTYAEVFERLAEVGLIDDHDRGVLAALARLRNVLVHLYVEIDLDRLHEALHSDLDPVRRFRSAAAGALSETNQPG